MALCGEKHVGNVTTGTRPTQVNGMMVWDQTVCDLMVSCGGVWNIAQGPAPIVPPNVATCWAAVAGGGAGGTGNGAGGGGAGGAILGNTNFSLNTWYCVSVGAGGAVAPGFFTESNPGSDTCFAGSLALGGGNGGGHPAFAGINGGSGGGGSQPNATCGLGTAAQGCNGGRGTGVGNSSAEYGGGGGGKCADGGSGYGNPPAYGPSGSGGNGFALDNQPAFPAHNAGGGTLAGGGGGGSGSPGSSGTGSAGGGSGGCNGGAPARSAGANASAQTGSGGGGGPGDTAPFGGNGGSGVIILFHDPFFCVVRSTPTIPMATAAVGNGCAGTYITGGSGCICFAVCP